MAHNPDKIIVRVFGDVSFDVFQSRLRGLFDDSELSVISPNNVEIPFGDFKRLLEQIALRSGRTKFHKELIGAVKNMLRDMTSGDTILGCSRDEAVVVVPKLFRSDFTLIGPVLDLYFPELANVSVVKVGDEFLRYDVFKELRNYESEPVLLEDLQEIPMPESNMSFESLHLMMNSLNNNESLLIVPNMPENSMLAGKASLLTNWMAVFDVLNTNVDEYLNQVSGWNGTSIYESLPWIGSRNQTTGVTLVPVPDLESSTRIADGQNVSDSDLVMGIAPQLDAPKSTNESTSEDLSSVIEEENMTTNSSNYDGILRMSRPSWDIRSRPATLVEPNHSLSINVTETAELRNASDATAARPIADYGENNSFVDSNSPIASALSNPVSQNQSQVLSCVVFCMHCDVTKNMTSYPPIPCAIPKNEKALPTTTPAFSARMEDDEIVNSAVWRRFTPGQASVPKLHASFIDSPEKSTNLKTDEQDSNRNNESRVHIDQLIKKSKKRDSPVQLNRKMNKNTKNSDTVLSRHQAGKSNRHEHPDRKAAMSNNAKELVTHGRIWGME